MSTTSKLIFLRRVSTQEQMIEGALGESRRRLLKLMGRWVTGDIVKCHCAVALPVLEQCLLIGIVCCCMGVGLAEIFARGCVLVGLPRVPALLALFAF